MQVSVPRLHAESGPAQVGPLQRLSALHPVPPRRIDDHVGTRVLLKSVNVLDDQRHFHVQRLIDGTDFGRVVI